MAQNPIGVIEETEASRAPVVEALEAIARNDLVSAADDDAPGEPLTADDRAVVALDDDSWAENVAMELEADETTIETVRETDARQADCLLRQTDADGGSFEDRTPVVIQPGRHYESGQLQE